MADSSEASATSEANRAEEDLSMTDVSQPEQSEEPTEQTTEPSVDASIDDAEASTESASTSGQKRKLEEISTNEGGADAEGDDGSAGAADGATDDAAESAAQDQEETKEEEPFIEYESDEDEEENLPTEESVKEMLKSLPQASLVDFALKLSLENLETETFNELRKSVENDPRKRRLFVRNLGWDVDEAGLKKAYSQFGKVADAVVVKDKITARSKGIGFVTYNRVKSAKKALAAGGCELNGRDTKCHVANDRSSSASRPRTSVPAYSTPTYTRPYTYSTTGYAAPAAYGRGYTYAYAPQQFRRY